MFATRGTLHQTPAVPQTASSPLSGVRVLDLTTFLSGPIAAQALVQLGAEVVKIEPPTGDPTRAGRPEPVSPFWWALHRDRKSVVLDLKNPAALAVLLDMVRHVDVVVENYRPGVTTRLGITFEALSAVNPSLIMCSITGYGASGPLSDAAAVDGAIQAFTGAFHLPGVFGERMGPVPAVIADLAGGTTAAQGVLAALVARSTGGTSGGCHVEVDLVGAVLGWLAVSDWVGSTRFPRTVIAEAADGRQFVVQTPLHFSARLAALLGLDHEDTPEYGDRVRNALRAKPRDEWIALLAREGIPASPVQTMAEALAHPDVASESGGGFTLPASPFQFNGERHGSAEPPPTLGEHTESVLRQLLGYDDETLSQLRTKGVFG